MRPYRRIIPIGVILTAALLFAATRGKSQAQAAQIWEYSSVMGSPGFASVTSTGAFSKTYTSSATICYADAQGCQYEQVTQSAADENQRIDAIMKATAILGAQGWELTTTSEVATDDLRERVLYFRRPKTVSN
jgi:hypothetical protein